MSSAKRVALHRAKASAINFSGIYLNGRESCPINEFIKAMEYQVCVKNKCSSVVFNDELITAFINHIVDGHDKFEGNNYTVFDLMTGWKLVNNND